ncbi:hypothetical protein BG004_004470 [Podila humilis]|nr:hypothetical protein BG004_004470 [Podila humilis]
MVKKIASKNSGNAITNFIRSEITAPEKRAGNTSIAISVTVFGLAVTFLRSLGDIYFYLEVFESLPVAQWMDDSYLLLGDQ